MQHYAVVKENFDVIAQSRSEELIQQYYKAMSKKKRAKSRVVTLDLSQDSRNEFEDKHRDVEVLEEQFLDEPVYEEVSDLYSFGKEEYTKLEFLIKDLDNIIINYSLHKEDRKTLKKAKKILVGLTHKRNFKEATGMSTITSLIRTGNESILKRLFVIGAKRK